MTRAAKLAALLSIAGTLASCSVSPSIAEEALCRPDNAGFPVLVAQAVPSATLLPCLRTLPPGWRYGGSQVRSGQSRFWLNSDRAGIHAVEVSLTPTCSVAGLADVTRASGELDVRVFLDPVSLHPYVADRYFVFTGGCVVYRYRFGDAEQGPELAFEVDDALTFVNRSVLVDLLQRFGDGATLCGAEAPPCVGED